MPKHITALEALLSVSLNKGWPALQQRKNKNLSSINFFFFCVVTHNEISNKRVLYGSCQQGVVLG